MNMNVATVPTPPGPVTIVATDLGVVRAAGFTTDIRELLAGADPRSRPDLGDITKAVRAYVEGDLTAVDDIPVEQPGGEFIAAAWQALRQTRPGEQLTYTDLAVRAGRPEAVRAAANACARNAVALFVPCHRVLRRDGGLGGYRWGTGVKRWLLDHER